MKKIKLVSMILALVMILTMFAGCGSNKSADNGNGTDSGVNGGTASDNGNTQQNAKKIDAGAMVLTENGTVPDGVSFAIRDIITVFEGSGDERKVQILNQSGVAFNDKWYSEVVSVITNGVCVVSNKDENGKEFLGIVDSIREKELVPCEAVEVRKLSDRFYLLGYETAAGTKDDCFGFYYDDGSVYYKGYGKIFDLENGQFVPGVEVTTSYLDISAVGNVVVIDKDFSTSEAYTAEGELIGTYDYLVVYPENGIALQESEEGIRVYDKDMKLVNTLVLADGDDTYSALDEAEEKLVYSYLKDNKRYYCVTDLYGKALSAEFDTRINKMISSDWLSVGVEVQIVDFEGNVVVPKDGYYVDGGYFRVNAEPKGYYLYDLSTGEKVYEGTLDFCGDLVFSDGEGGVLIYATGEMMNTGETIRPQTGSLVLIGTTIYDVVTGKAVLTDVDACVSTGDNIYTWNNEAGVYTRYTVEFKE